MYETDGKLYGIPVFSRNMTSGSEGKADSGAMPEEGRHASARDALLFALTFIAGCVDAISFLGLGQVFTANMTGNTILMAIAVGNMKFLAASRSAVALLGFAGGGLLAGKLVDPGRNRIIWSSKITRVLEIELAFVLVFAASWFIVGGAPGQDIVLPLIALSACGMGIQSGAARRLSVSGVSTVVVTSTLTALMAELAALGTSTPNKTRWAAVMLSLFGGGAAGAVLLSMTRAYAAILPLVVLCAVCLAATRRFH